MVVWDTLVMFYFRFLHLLGLLIYVYTLHVSFLFIILFINNILYKSLLFGGVRYTDYVGDCPLLSNGRGTWGYFHITQSHNRPTIRLILLWFLYFLFHLKIAFMPNQAKETLLWTKINVKGQHSKKTWVKMSISESLVMLLLRSQFLWVAFFSLIVSVPTHHPRLVRSKQQCSDLWI